MFTFAVTPDDGEPFEVTADSRTISLWERTLSGRSMAMLDGASIKMSYLEELAHMAAKKAGKWDGNLADFRENCVIDLQQPGQGDGLDPTPTDR